MADMIHLVAGVHLAEHGQLAAEYSGSHLWARFASAAIMAAVAGLVALAVRRANRRARATGPAPAPPAGMLAGAGRPETAAWSFTVTGRPFQWRAARLAALVTMVPPAGLLPAWFFADPATRDDAMLWVGLALAATAVWMACLPRAIRRFRIEVAWERARAVPMWGQAREFNVRDIESLRPTAGSDRTLGIVALGLGKRRLFVAQSTAIGYRELVAWIRHWRPDPAWPKGILEQARRITGDPNL
jgi:hypothetical protein